VQAGRRTTLWARGASVRPDEEVCWTPPLAGPKIGEFQVRVLRRAPALRRSPRALPRALAAGRKSCAGLGKGNLYAAVRAKAAVLCADRDTPAGRTGGHPADGLSPYAGRAGRAAGASAAETGRCPNTHSRVPNQRPAPPAATTGRSAPTMCTHRPPAPPPRAPGRPGRARRLAHINDGVPEAQDARY